jgi:hypothetical protein
MNFKLIALFLALILATLMKSESVIEVPAVEENILVREEFPAPEIIPKLKDIN